MLLSCLVISPEAVRSQSKFNKPSLLVSPVACVSCVFCVSRCVLCVLWVLCVLCVLCVLSVLFALYVLTPNLENPNKTDKLNILTTGAKESPNVEKTQIFGTHKLSTKAVPSRDIKTACKYSIDLGDI